MNTCKNCGAALLEGSRFCEKCGTSVDVPLKTICSKCQNEAPDGMIFCNKCGNKLDLRKNPTVNKSKTITITRESQFVCLAVKYKVIVNGNDLGYIGAGQTLRTTVNTPAAAVDIRCATITMMKHKVKLILKLGENPKITFKLQLGGGILPTVIDATVLEQH